MIQLLFLVLFAEGVVAFLLLVKIGPLRELVMKGLDQLKMGKGPATVKTIACTMLLILASSITSIVKIQNKGAKLGTVTPMDQVLWRTHLLEASLMGRFHHAMMIILLILIIAYIDLYHYHGHADEYEVASILAKRTVANGIHSTTEYLIRWKDNDEEDGYSLFLGFIIDRLHHYLQKLFGLRTTVGASKQELEKLQKEHLQLKEKEEQASKEIKLLQEEIFNLTDNLKKLKLECEDKDKQVLSAEAHVTALQKQAEDLLLEYDRLLEDNQNLQSQNLAHRI
ncbi:hypothetical protein HHK36_027116 [Tetracentron sinense]|uniref:Endoplasmic reticulum transmembrane protein n=1 Tax=Tetracentron sinense TaxID=13715 RepID=A0A835D637_TETSI|nr:hypothetical protein HHK36_027116 [Tetracentron sinense]